MTCEGLIIIISIWFTDTAAEGDDVSETAAVESALQQTVSALHVKQQLLENEQIQVNVAFLNLS